MQSTLSTTSLVCGVIGSLLLSYDLLGKRGGPLRACVVGLSLAIISSLVVGGATVAVAQVFRLPVPMPIEVFLFSRNLLYIYFGIGFVGGLFLYASFVAGELTRQRAARQRELQSTLLVFGGLLFVGLIGYLGISGFQRTGSLSYLIDYGAFLVSFFALIPVGALVLWRVLRWVDTLGERELGRFGALLTLVAFGMQLVIAMH